MAVIWNAETISSLKVRATIPSSLYGGKLNDDPHCNGGL
jgi:hypothetical protein